jgi:hypothetical protein
LLQAAIAVAVLLDSPPAAEIASPVVKDAPLVSESVATEEPEVPHPTTPSEAVLQQLVAAVHASGKTSSSKPQNPRVLFIVSKDNPHCEEELARLRRPGGDFETMQSQGWKIGPGPENHLQIIDQKVIAEYLKHIDLKHYPVILCVSGEEIVRSFRTGCTTPLDAWTFGWLAKGVNERPEAEVAEAAKVESTGHFPLRGNHWSIDEDWYPSRERVIGHLRGAHGNQLQAAWAIESWSYEELRSLHDYIHEQIMGGVQYSSRPAKAAKKGFSKL